MIELTFSSSVAAHRVDDAFFRMNKHRQFRARHFVEDDAACLAGVTLFDWNGQSVNRTIIKHIGIGRVRQFYAVPGGVSLDTDAAIKVYLLSRGIDPATMRALSS